MNNLQIVNLNGDSICTDTGKHKYESRNKAAKSGKIISKRKALHRGLHPYKCEFCAKWHLTGRKR